jgi:hypothetical protein
MQIYNLGDACFVKFSSLSLLQPNEKRFVFFESLWDIFGDWMNGRAVRH